MKLKKLSNTKKELLAFFDRHTLAKGEDYFDRNKVIRYVLRDSTNEVVGDVSGSRGRVYKAVLYLDEHDCDLVATDCTCPIGEDCKHTAALYMAYLSEIPDVDLEELFDKSMQTLAEIESEFESSKVTGRRLTLVSSTKQPDSVSQDSRAVSESVEGKGVETEPANLRLSLLPAKLEPVSAEIKRSFESFASALRHNDTVGGGTTGAYHQTSSRTRLLYILQKEHWRGDLNIELVSVNTLKNGSFGKESKISLWKMFSKSPACAGEEDFEILRFWQAISRQNEHYWSDDLPLSSADPALALHLISKILKTGRCYFENLSSGPLTLGRELPGEIAWEEYRQGQLRLAVVGRDGDKTHPCLRSSHHFYYVDVSGGKCGPVVTPLESSKLKPLLSMRAITRQEAVSIAPLLCDLGLAGVVPPPPVQSTVSIKLVKPSVKLSVESCKSQAVIPLGEKLLARPGDSLRLLVVEVDDAVAPNPYLEGATTVVEKPDTEFVKEGVDTLVGWRFGELAPFVVGEKSKSRRYFLPAEPEAWASLDESGIDRLRAQGFEISQTTEAHLKPLELDSDSLDLEVYSGEDNWWFSLALNVDINGRLVPLLPILVSAIRGLPRSESIADSIDVLNRDGRFVGAMPDGSLISLPFERIRSILISLKELIEKGLDPNEELPVVEAAELLDETLSKSRFIKADKVRRLVEGLRALRHIEPVTAPSKFKTDLRDYQKEGLSWLQFMAQYEFGGILADDMGLGKTVQLLAHICLEKEKGRLSAPYLVICPTSVLPNWLAEASKFAPHLKVVAFHGEHRFGKQLLMKKADLVVSTYPLLVRDLSTFKTIEWHGLALDEAQAIKNHRTKMAQAARSIKANHKFCMTGTPVENHLGELWSQFQFTLPGLLGDSTTFREVFRDPIEKSADLGKKQKLARRIKPFMIRRTKEQVAKELPEKTEIVQTVELTGDQRELYETVRLACTKQIRDEIAKKGFKHSQIMILDALLKMRQACCDPRLVKLSAAAKVTGSAKLDTLIDMLEELVSEGRKVLLFSQFTSMLALIETRLTDSGLRYVKITGDTKDRTTPVREFQEGTVPIFLISLKAGGTGLNLTAADVVIHYDPWWNPAVERQATDRAHRIGQTKKIFVYKLIASGTIEQRILELQEKKRLIAESIYDKDGNLGTGFSESDLDALLRPIDELVEF